MDSSGATTACGTPTCLEVNAGGNWNADEVQRNLPLHMSGGDYGIQSTEEHLREVPPAIWAKPQMDPDERRFFLVMVISRPSERRLFRQRLRAASLRGLFGSKRVRHGWAGTSAEESLQRNDEGFLPNYSPATHSRDNSGIACGKPGFTDCLLAAAQRALLGGGYRRAPPTPENCLPDEVTRRVQFYWTRTR